MKELFRDGLWALNEEHKWVAGPGQVWKWKAEDTWVSHNCHNREWSVKCAVPEWKRCHNCGVAVPAALIGLKALVEWDR